MTDDRIQVNINVLETPSRDLVPTVQTGGSTLLFQNEITNGLLRTPTNPTALTWVKFDEQRETKDGTRETFEIDVKCLRRGNCQLSLFEGEDEIKLSDTSKRVFVALLSQIYDYYNNNGKDTQNLLINLTPKVIAPYLSISFSSNPKTRKNQAKEARTALKKFEKEISEIRVIATYSYYDELKTKRTRQFDGGVFNKDTHVRDLDENGKVIREGFPINPSFYYSLVDCFHVLQIPFTAFAITGKNAFSIVYDLYAHSRENKGKQEIRVKTLLDHLGFTDRINGPHFRDKTILPIIEILRNSVGSAITPNFKFISNAGKDLDLDNCTNKEWVDSTLVWEQIIPSETPILLENKAKIEAKKKRSRATKRRTSPTTPEKNG